MNYLDIPNVEILDFIREFMTKHGFSPTFREIANEFGISTSTVHVRLQEMQKQGRLTYVPHRAGTLKLVDQ